jgi:hypothetical protein
MAKVKGCYAVYIQYQDIRGTSNKSRNVPFFWSEQALPWYYWLQKLREKSKENGEKRKRHFWLHKTINNHTILIHSLTFTNGVIN